MKRLVHSREKEAPEKVVVLMYKNGMEIMVRTENGLICSAVDNPFTGMLHLDDVWGVYGKAVEK